MIYGSGPLPELLKHEHDAYAVGQLDVRATFALSDSRNSQEFVKEAHHVFPDKVVDD